MLNETLYSFICNENDDDDGYKEDQEFGKGLSPNKEDNKNDDKNEK